MKRLIRQPFHIANRYTQYFSPTAPKYNCTNFFIIRNNFKFVTIYSKIKNIMATKKISLNELRNIVKQIIKEEMILNEDNLVLNNYAKQLYSLFKKEGATPLIATGKNYASPDIKNYNVSIMVTNNGELHVGIKGVNKANAEKYANLVSKQFQDLQLKGNINFGTGWGGEQDSYADLTLIPKTTKKGGEVNPNQRPNAPKPQAQQQQPVSESLRLRNNFK